MIYLDNAATSWPKPPEVIRAMANLLENAGGNPGRSGHRLSVAAGRVLYDTREALAELFGADDPLRVVLSPNVTYALNIALTGLLRPGDRVVTTGIEHNSVMRPLRSLQAAGVLLDVVPCAPDGHVDMERMAEALRAPASVVVANHASNVVGTIAPVGEIALLAHRAGALFIVDAAQTGGVLPIDVQALGIDLLAFTGHKGLLGPTGTGGLVIAPHLAPERFRPVFTGGTGSRSEEELPPEVFPDRLEAGTPNSVGIAGLGAAVRFLQATGVETIRRHERGLLERLLNGLREIPGVRMYGPTDVSQRTATVSVRIEGMSESEIGWRLDEEYGILCRVGLHCAPAAHRTLGTFPHGTVRLSAGVFTTYEEIDQAVAALRDLAQSRHRD
ncbi:MAG: aminotransferase class V-fold PLP-dependent enzyme [Chloroflexi bacterium]|nr:aminotransferase class V-fold PLP-dependent enzyme [Chloroflexota bacterium]